MFGLRFPRDTREHAPSYYAATASEHAPCTVAEGELHCDVAVVGGGFSGVNTALELAERGRDVILLEANRIGWGATGRNGGQLIGGVGHSAQKFRRAIGDAGVSTIRQLGVECVEIVRERVARYAIDCDLAWGYCDVALKPRHLRWFEETLREERASAYPHELVLLDREEVKEFVGSDAYIGGLYNASGAGHLHPLNLCLGEARAARDLGVRIFEQSRVDAITPGDSVLLRSGQAVIRARTAVLCGNAYMGQLVPRLASRVLPASSCVIATEPLSEALAHSVLPRNVAACDPRTALDYFRLTADRRLLFGGLSNYTGLVPDNYPGVMQRKMLQIFPQLAGVAIDYAWDGQMGIGLNRMPQAGRLGDNVYYMQAYSGHGVAPAHVLARVTAEAIGGDSRRFDILGSIRHWPFPGGRYLRRPALAVGMLYFKARDFF